MYLFDTPDDVREMLSAIGEVSVDALLEQVPADLRLDRPLELPGAYGLDSTFAATGER